jgi:hypothetical protein
MAGLSFLLHFIRHEIAEREEKFPKSGFHYASVRLFVKKDRMFRIHSLSHAIPLRFPAFTRFSNGALLWREFFDFGFSVSKP